MFVSLVVTAVQPQQDKESCEEWEGGEVGWVAEVSTVQVQWRKQRQQHTWWRHHAHSYDIILRVYSSQEMPPSYTTCTLDSSYFYRHT